jgi:hypothetical protein
MSKIRVFPFVASYYWQVTVEVSEPASTRALLLWAVHLLWEVRSFPTNRQLSESVRVLCQFVGNA